VRDRQQPNRLLYIAFSSFQGVAQGDMKNSSENLQQPVRLLIVRDRQQPNRLLYIAFSSFQGVAQGDMKNSFENVRQTSVCRVLTKIIFSDQKES